MTKKLFPLAMISFLLLSGCTGGQGAAFFPGVHKISIQQGSKITQDMVDQLRPGMTKTQVRFVLGTPLLADTFNQDRWDYHYILLLGDGRELEERFSVFFKDELLESFEGDFAPSSEAESDDEDQTITAPL